MKTILTAGIVVAFAGLSGCSDKSAMMQDDSVNNTPVNEPSRPSEGTMLGGAGTDPMSELCMSKGGSIGEWGGDGEGTKTCQMGDGSEYPLASISSYPAFQ